ncbi:MAG: hypothetical protein K5785_03880 [Nitrosarchaeum sp.]|nr:hypothetical protein [Nitrosarchaeum sp.]
MKVNRIIFYDEPSVPEINLDSLAEFTSKTFGITPEKRESILTYGNESTARHIASARIFKLSVPYIKHIPTSEEIEFEKKNMADTSTNQNITYYDGFELQNILRDIIPKDESGEDVFHVVFTNKLTCTYDYSDYRYHGRALIGANPAIISTTGIIEAPAKPRDYYVDLITNSRLGVNVDALKEKYKGMFLEYHDARLTTIIEGYLLQALFYYETAEPFCDDVECRLFNAHWQKDLLYSQIESRKLCKKHQEILQKLTMT